MVLANQWTEKTYKKLIDELKLLKDEKYRLFNSKIVNTNLPMIGIRTPILRNIAKKVAKTNIESYLACCKDKYFEEVLLQGLVIAQIKNDELSFSYFEKFIKKIDNWSICDMVISSMKIVKKNKKIYLYRIKNFIKDYHEFTVRVGLVLLLDYYIEKEYLPIIFDLVDDLKREEHYINMAIAWLLSVCYIKYKAETLKYLDNNNLSKFVYNKAIQKIIESKRVSSQEKEILRHKKRP